MTDLTHIFRGPARRRAPAILAWLTAAVIALTTLAAPAGAVVYNLTVPANVEMSDMGIDLAVGDQVTITASGTWTNNPDNNPPPYGPDGTGTPDATTVCPTAPVGMLIGRVGGSNYFPVGSNFSFTITLGTYSDGGRLRLGFNDKSGTYGDNSGQVNVTITVTSPSPDIVNDAVRAFKYNGQPTDAPVAGELATIQMDLRNGGQAASGSFTTVYYVNGAQIATENHADMAPGATHTTGVTYTFPSAGSYQLRAEATNVTGEQNTTNNSKEATVTVAPDVSGAYWYHPGGGLGSGGPGSRVWAYSPVQGPYYLPITVSGDVYLADPSKYDQAELMIRANPNGTASYPAASPDGFVYSDFISFSGYTPNSTSISTHNISPVGNSGGLTTHGSWQPFTVTFTADGIAARSGAGSNHTTTAPAGQVAASGITQWQVYFHGGSTATAPGYVQFKNVNVIGGSAPSVPDISVTDLRTLSAPVAGQSVGLEATLTNVGSASSGQFTQNFYVNGTNISSTTANDVPVGTTGTPGINYTFPTAGSYQLKYEAISVSGEQVTTNNSREVTVPVVSPDFSGDFFTHPGGDVWAGYVSQPLYLPITVTGEVNQQAGINAQVAISNKPGDHLATRQHSANTIYNYFAMNPGHLSTAASNWWTNVGGGQTSGGEQYPSKLAQNQWVPFTMSLSSNGSFQFSGGGSGANFQVPSQYINYPTDGRWYALLEGMPGSNVSVGAVRYKNVTISGGSAPQTPEIINDAVRAFKYEGLTTDAPVAGQQASIQMDLRNGGSANSGSFTTNYYVNGALIGSENYADMAPGATHTTGITGNFFPNAGNYQVRAEAANVTGEQNTSNNSKEVTITVSATPAPDIEVLELRVWDVEANAVATTIVHGKLYDMQARLKNVGAAEGGNWTNNFYMNGSSFLAGPYNTAYAVGEERWTGYDYTFPAAGSYTFRFLVTGVSGENNTANNEKSLTVTVVNPPAPDVEIIGLALDPVSPSAGVPAEITASYENRGDAPTGEFTIRYLVNGLVVGEAAAATLSPGANAQKTFAYTFPAAGNVTIAAVAVNVSGEIALGNNQRDLAATGGPRPPEGVLSASPSTLDFGTVKPGDAAENKSFSATIDGGAGAFNLTVSSSAGWFTTDVQRDQGGVVAMPRTGGLYNQTVTITDVDFSNLAEGQHASVVTVAAPEPIGSKQVTVRVEIENPQPVIVVGVTEFDLGSFLATEAPADRTFEISNAGTGELTGTLTTAAAWIAVTPTAFTTAPSAATEARLAFDLSGLAEGAHTGKVTVASNGGPDHEITVQVEVIAADADPELAVSDDRIAFGSVEIAAPGADAEPYEKTVFVRNSGGGSISWRVRSDAEWVSVTPGEATAMEREVEVKIAIAPARLTEGKNEARLTIEATELGQSVEIEVTAEGMKVARLWDLEMTPTTIEVGGGGKTERLSRGQLDVGARGGERFSIRIAVGARNLDLGLAERAVVAAVKSWRPGEVVTVGKVEGGAERRLNYSEAFELPARTGIYYVGLLMGGVHEGEEAAGFDRLPVNGGQGNPIGNGNDVWDPPTSAWEGAATNGFFLHDLDGDGENRRWPAVVVKIRVTGVDPARRRLAEGDVRIVGVEYAGEVVDAANVKLIPRGGTGGAAPLDNQPPMANRPGATHASPLRDGPSSVERPGAGDHGARHAVPLRIRAVVRNPAGGDDGVAVLRVLVLPTLPGMPGRILDDVTIGPGNEREIEWTADVRTPRGEGIHYVGIVVGREEELREIRSQGLARNAMEEGIQNGRTALLLAANENRPADFAVRAVRLATEQPPAIEAIPAALIVKADQDGGNVAEGVVRLRNVAGGLLEGNAAASEAWVQARPQAFVGNEVEIRIRVDVAEFLRNRALRGSAGLGAGGGPAENVIPSGVIAITTSGGDVLVPISVEIPKGGAIPPPGSLTIHEVRADGPFPKLRWRAEAPGGRYRLTVRDALTGKTGWSVEIGDDENGAIDYAGFPLIPNREYIIAIRHTSWNAPVERRFRVADYRVGW